MIRWPWSRREHVADHEFIAAARRLARDKNRLKTQRANTRHATARLESAVAAERAEINRNHLGELLHDALIGRPHT